MMNTSAFEFETIPLIPLFEDIQNIFCGSLCSQMDKRQDIGVHGVYDKGYYIGAFDGHGTNACVDVLRTLDYAEVAKDPLNISDSIERHVRFVSVTDNRGKQVYEQFFDV
jgi:hypothetical protein